LIALGSYRYERVARNFGLRCLFVDRREEVSTARKPRSSRDWIAHQLSGQFTGRIVQLRSMTHRISQKATRDRFLQTIQVFSDDAEA
jgi:hypothetical protein